MIDYDYWANMHKTDEGQFNRRKDEFLADARNRLAQAEAIAEISHQARSRRGLRVRAALVKLRLATQDLAKLLR